MADRMSAPPINHQGFPHRPLLHRRRPRTAIGDRLPMELVNQYLWGTQLDLLEFRRSLGRGQDCPAASGVGVALTNATADAFRGLDAQGTPPSHFRNPIDFPFP
jgi:hypothetical protein